jgi:hypothetical protein
VPRCASELSGGESARGAPLALVAGREEFASTTPEARTMPGFLNYCLTASCPSGASGFGVAAV